MEEGGTESEKGEMLVEDRQEWRPSAVTTQGNLDMAVGC